MVHGQDLSEEIENLQNSYKVENYLGAGEAAADIAKKVFSHAQFAEFNLVEAGADATCPCDHAFEYFVAFTN